jgi:hypothetical protein
MSPAIPRQQQKEHRMPDVSLIQCSDYTLDELKDRIRQSLLMRTLFESNAL